MYNVDVYKTKAVRLPGKDFRIIYKKAYDFYKELKRKTKRRPYVRSAYFKKEKIFLELFWHHLNDKKNLRDKKRRVRYFPCAIELIIRSKFRPISKENPNKRSEILHRFAGITPEKNMFFVQIKEDKKSGNKWLISVFPWEK
ncbi:MAG: hypothetical protein FJZ04_02660 [Candidatus Moranbacteria bacterium]|nr:hypothetical protein [Candidatus Moranbacteria bacterium]